MHPCVEEEMSRILSCGHWSLRLDHLWFSGPCFGFHRHCMDHQGPLAFYFAGCHCYEGMLEMSRHENPASCIQSPANICVIYRYNIYLKMHIDTKSVLNAAGTLTAVCHDVGSRNLPDSVAHSRQHHAPSILLANYKVPQPNAFRLRHLVTM